MPGLLKSDAWCPMCGRDIVAISRTTTHRFGDVRVELEFDHKDQTVLPHIQVGRQDTMDRIHDRLTVNP